MKISDILSEELIVPALSASGKEAVLREMSSHICAHCDGLPTDSEGILNALLCRERLGSTGVGEGVAIPHAKIPGLKNLVACFGRAEEGVPFDAIDQQPVRLVFVLLVPENSAGAHLKALARISRLLKDAGFRERLLTTTGGSHSLFVAFLEEDNRH